jgi:hypothetical protein
VPESLLEQAGFSSASVVEVVPSLSSLVLRKHLLHWRHRRRRSIEPSRRRPASPAKPRTSHERNMGARASHFAVSLRSICTGHWLVRFSCRAFRPFAVPETVFSCGAPTVATSDAGLGEILQYTAEGRLLSRWTGLSDIQSVHISGAGLGVDSLRVR